MENAVGGSYNGGVDGGGNTEPPQKWESPPPPFLTKLYEIVEDSQTNSLISWNSDGTSFVIWDHNKFSAEILPKYFRTTNFSSIVYQLNNYGFRKISCDHYEYKNPWFQSRKKHWLLNIKRKNQQQIHVPKKQGRASLVQNSGNATMESKLDAITNEQNSMKEHMKKLKSSLRNMEDQLASLQSNMNIPKIEDEKMNAALLLKQLVSEKNDHDDGSNLKKRKLNDPLITASAFEAADNAEFSTKELVVSSYADDSGSSTQDQMMNNMTESRGNCALWNEFIGVEDEGDLATQYSKAIMVLDEKLASDIAMGGETFSVKESSDSILEDDCQLKLWT